MALFRHTQEYMLRVIGGRVGQYPLTIPP
ncbi:hypothetical protein BRAS3809_2510024 [Bradyrhizobium sp. STM 3809]|nr:hypothetical protein BRAS3809_2510024 [Bradyrhizobium sp. STM 3809]